MDEERIVELTTPYLDRHNDYIQLYVTETDGGYVLTDGGETIQELRMSGRDLDTEILTSTLNGFGIRRDGDELSVLSSCQDFEQSLRSLVEAIKFMGEEKKDEATES